jgi:hypothetical protein
MSKERGLPLNVSSITQRAKNAGLPRGRVVREVAVNQMHHRLAHGGVHWVLKGGEALLARRVSARATRDVDLRVPDTDLDGALAQFRDAITADLGDGLSFNASPPKRELSAASTGGYPGVTVTITVTLGARLFDEFGLDLVVGRPLTGSPVHVAQPLSLDMPELTAATVLVYPTVDHIADKLNATHARYGEQGRPSSRVKDVYDLCALRGADDVHAELLYEAIATESLARHLEVPASVSVPPSMATRYESQVRGETPNPLVPASFKDALVAIGAFLDPVLSGDVRAGRWDPVSLTWLSR